MGKNRVIYQSEALYVSEDIDSTTAAQHEQLERVQSANYSFSISRQDINQYGQLARIDSLVLEPPTVSVDFSYYLTDGFNERALGFYVQTAGANEGNFASGHMVTSSGRNIYITTVGEGEDNINQTGIDSAIGIGNVFLSDYTLDLAVGSLPTVSVTLEGSNINGSLATGATGVGYTGVLVDSPAVNPTNGTSLGLEAILGQAQTGASDITALRPGDVTVSIENFNGVTIADLSGDGSIHVQSASLSLPLSRSPLQRLGSKFPFARTVDFPVVGTLNVNGIVSEATSAELSTTLDDNSPKTVTITINDTNGTARSIFTMKGCRLESESFSSSIGSNKSVDLVFSTQIGGPEDTDNGIFYSGANTDAIFS